LGAELWAWYALFEFDEFDTAVLECLYQGNATYIIRGDWESVVPHTKPRPQSPDSRVLSALTELGRRADGWRSVRSDNRTIE
jgi:hypothetical protein